MAPEALGLHRGVGFVAVVAEHSGGIQSDRFSDTGGEELRAAVEEGWRKEGAFAAGGEEIAGEEDVRLWPKEAAVSGGVSGCVENVNTASYVYRLTVA